MEEPGAGSEVSASPSRQPTHGPYLNTKMTFTLSIRNICRSDTAPAEGLTFQALTPERWAFGNCAVLCTSHSCTYV
ncbi:uncharacterized protein LOC119868428 isoform X3 [Canis lupus familiaris]|uniref:uncharacterized protein LOC119868428 isoform X3 n=1 Tax=Canis lupus familiaris TaxID=9615 RepID=UPI00005A5D1F|nr:uncharacterized protein LOC119868428 isoform X3 [Canis lupus familiaris]